MYVIHGTKKLLNRLKRPLVTAAEVETSTVLGNWYGNFVPWRPQVAILVNETTLLAVLMPLAPAKTLPERFPQHLAAVLEALYVPEAFIEKELAEMTTMQTAKTANRVVVGSMTEFIKMADHHRYWYANSEPDLIEISTWLADTPCGPLRKGRIYPKRELDAIIKTH